MSVLSLDILSTVKKCQLQNGVRHDDYQRYRQYCTRRLKRIRNNGAVEFSHRGQRGKYEKNELTVEMCKNPLFLLIPLMNAERAWGYAMQLKQDNEINGEDLRRTAHMIRRLSKAAKWASKLSDLCSVLGDDRTVLQAEAYSAWMNGNFLLEKDELKEALPLFSQSKEVYTQLSKVSTLEQKELMEEKLENLELVIMYCTRYLSREGTNSQELADMISRSKDSTGLIQSKLAKVMADSMKVQAHEGFEVKLLERAIPVRNEATALLLLSADGNIKTLDSLTSSVEDLGDKEWEKIDNLFVDTFSKYDDAARNVRNDINKADANAASSDIPQEHVVEELKLLRTYVKIQKLDKVIRRNTLLSERLEKQYEDQMEKRLEADIESKLPVTENKKGENKSTKQRQMSPQDLQRMFEKISLNISNQLDLVKEAAKETSASAEKLEFKLDIEQNLVEAKKNFYEAKNFAAAKKWQEALNAYEQAFDSAQEILEGEGRNVFDEKQVEDVVQFQKNAGVGKRLAQARVFLARTRSGTNDEIDNEVESDYVGRPLRERLEENEIGEIVETPPALVSVPARPIMFDLAFNRMQSPDFSNRTKNSPSKVSGSEQQSGWLRNAARGWFGSGN